MSTRVCLSITLVFVSLIWLSLSASAETMLAPVRGTVAFQSPTGDDEKREDVAVIFAVNKHSKKARKQGWVDLKYSIADAEALKWTLENQYGFKVTLVEDPTWEEINLHMEQLKYKNWNDLDQLLVYFTGHGYRSPEGKGYLVPSNAEASIKTFYEMEELREQINDIDCNNIVLGIDACFASSFLERGQTNISSRRGNSTHSQLSSDLPFRYFIGSAPSNREVPENGIFLKESEIAGKFKSYKKKFKVTEFMMAFLESIAEVEKENKGDAIPIWEVGRKIEGKYKPKKKKSGDSGYARATRFGVQNDRGFHFFPKNKKK